MKQPVEGVWKRLCTAPKLLGEKDRKRQTTQAMLTVPSPVYLPCSGRHLTGPPAAAGTSVWELVALFRWCPVLSRRTWENVSIATATGGWEAGQGGIYPCSLSFWQIKSLGQRVEATHVPSYRALVLYKEKGER